MKLLNKVGDTLLTKLVPGIEAKAGCGQCRYGGYSCSVCNMCSGGWLVGGKIFYDDCGYKCYSTCDYGYLCRRHPGCP